MSSKHFQALEELFDSIEEEIGSHAGPRTCDALGNAKDLINKEHDREERKRSQ